MKKRKPPIVLATFLVIMLTAMALVYSPSRKTDDHSHDEPQPQAENVDRPKLTNNQSSALVKNAMKPNMPSGPQLQKPGMPGGPNEPSIKVNKPVNTKPMPSDSGTSTQWYTPETPK